MQSKERERSVVITGASSGIGAACALALSESGWRVFAGVLSEAEGEQLRARAEENLVTVVIDVTDESSIERARDTVAAALDGGGLDALVNNAGISITSPLELVPLDDLRNQFEVNVIGAIATAQAFLPLIRTAHGRVVNMGSALGWMSMPFLGPYCASKAALERLTDVLRLELEPWDIKVSLIAAGPVATQIWDRSVVAAAYTARKMSLERRRLYTWPSSMKANAGMTESKNQITTDEVVRAVAHAVSSGKPRKTYVVGAAARSFRLFHSARTRDIREKFLELFTSRTPVPGRYPQ